MKKGFLLLCTVLCSMGMKAQLVSSESRTIVPVERVVVEKPKRTTWMVRLGVGSNTFVGDSYDYTDPNGDKKSVGSKAGYFLGFEFNKTLGSKGAYWGEDFAFASRGWKMSESENGATVEQKLAAHTFHWSPFIFGWKIQVPNSKFSIDPHIGVYLAVDMAGKYKWEYSYEGRSDSGDTKIGDADDYMRFDGGLKVGVGVWYNKKYNFDLTYQRGFVAEDTDYDGGASNFWIRLGYAF